MIELRLLGAVDLRAPGGEPLRSVLVQPKRLALLAYLALAKAGAFQRRDVLLGVFWPELDARRARGSLRAALHHLRRSLGEEAIESRGAEEIALRPGALWCDVLAFEQACDQGRPAEAMALYRGHLLEGFFVEDAAGEFEQWLDRERTRLRALGVAASWDLSQVAQTAGDPAAALRWARRATELAPDDEAGFRRLLELLEAQGDRAGALRAYDALARQLAADYGVEPAEETQRVVERIRTRGPQVTATEPGTTRLHPAQERESPPAGAPPLQPQAVTAAATRRWRRGVLPAALTVGGLTIALWSLRDRSAAGDAGPPPGSPEPRATRGREPGPFFEVVLEGGVARSHFSVVFDPRRDLALVFGGSVSGPLFNDLWRLDGASRGVHATWTAIEPAGPRPAPRSLHRAAYDLGSDRMMVMGGGLGHTAPCTNEVWVLLNASGRRAPAAWRQLHPSGALPAPRADHTVVYSERSSRLIVFGGHDCIAPRFNDTWVLTHANAEGGAPVWQRVDADTTAGAPAPRSLHSAVYDLATNRMMVLGGGDPDGQVFDDLWILHDADGIGRPRWEQVDAGGETRPGTLGHTAIYSAPRNRMLVFGGTTQQWASNELWLLDHASGDRQPRWRRIPLSRAPPPRIAHGAVYDPSQDHMIILSGQGPGMLFTDVWRLRNATASR